MTSQFRGNALFMTRGSWRSFLTYAIFVIAFAGCGGGSNAGGGDTGQTGDTVPPVVALSSPGATPFSTSASSIDLSGTASDNTGVTQIVWVNDRGGSGTATGTAAWSITGIALEPGTNTITVTARDAAGNVGAAVQSVFLVIPNSYYLSEGGSDLSDGSLVAPWATFAKAWSVLQPGDTLIVADGSYAFPSPPAQKSGLAGGEIIIRAASPGNAHLTSVLSLRGNAYLSFIGFKITGASSAVSVRSNGVGIPSHHLTFQQIGFNCTSVVLNDEACFSLSDGTHHVLLEDSWGWGGGRYTVMCYGGSGGNPPNITCDNNTFRRLVLRMGPSTSTSGNPQASLSLYYASNNLVENVIAIDGMAASNSSNSAFYITGHAPPPNADSNHFFGVIALNNLGIGFYLDCPGAVCNSNEVHNSVFWDSASEGIVTAGGTAVGDACDPVTLNNNTVGSSGSHGYLLYACYNGTLTNNVFFSNSGFGVNKSNTGSITTNHHNGYFGNTAGPRNNLSAGTGDLTSAPGFSYITRIEFGSAYHNAGASGDIGANVVNRYQNGTLTGTALWPWPNEDRIKTEMCAGVSGGLCSSGKTLTRYIWEYLGSTIPDGIY